MSLSFSKSNVSAYLRAGVIMFFAAIAINGNAQNIGTLPPNNQVFTAVENSAEFPGGIEKFYEFIKATLKYPETAKQNGVKGKVFLTFVVEKDGSLNNIKVLRGIGSGCDEEAVRVIKASPKWKPGTQNGNIVRQQYTVPISFGTPTPSVNGEASMNQPTGENGIYSRVEQPAEFPGGIENLYKYLAKNLQYPKAARENKVQGKVFITFIIEKDGSLTDFKVLRGIGSGCDEEAIRAMKGSPKWKPAAQDGKQVRQQYTIPISFTLTDK
jgi:TonB family protein